MGTETIMDTAYRLVGKTRRLRGTKSVSFNTRPGLALMYQLHGGTRLYFDPEEDLTASAFFLLSPPPGQYISEIRYLTLPVKPDNGKLTITVRGDMVYQVILAADGTQPEQPA